MANAHILVVEDEGIIAESIRLKLNRAGYTTTEVVTSGEKALEQAAAMRPDLALMDIGLAGAMDGVVTAQQLRARFDIPVVYLTAHTDEVTLQRAKLTEPFGYITKPFEINELRSVIETALYKHDLEKKLRASEQKYHQLFAEMVGGIALHEIICDSAGQPVDYVTLEVNHAYESLLGVKSEQIIGTKAAEILPQAELQQWLAIFGPVALTGVSAHYELYSAVNQKHFEGVAYCPERGKFAVTFADVTARKQAEEVLQQRQHHLELLNLALKTGRRSP